MEPYLYPHDIKAILFDFDGVVINSEPLYEKAGFELFEDLGLKNYQDFFKTTKGVSETDFYLKVIETFHLTTPMDVLRKKGRAILESTFQSKIDYVDGFCEFYNVQKEIRRTGLVTATRGAFLDKILMSLSVGNTFEIVVNGDMVTYPKPHPEPYLLACEKMNLAPKNVMVIEDSIPGTTSAYKAGCLTVGITTSYPKKELKNTHLVVDTFKELSHFLTIMKLENNNDLV